MTSKQLLDAFSETLMQDERILNPRERDLLTSILQQARDASISPQIQSAVSAAIARSVGETVAQRAFALLGSSIVEQILGRNLSSSLSDDGVPRLFSGPHPPPGDAPKPPSGPGPLDQPGPHPPPGPQPPGVSLHRSDAGKQAEQSGIALLERKAESRQSARAQYVVLDEFLAPQQVEELIRYSLEHEAEFENSEVVSPSGGVMDYSHRRSRVLCELGGFEQVILERVQAVLPGVLEQLGMDDFSVTRREVQITASNDGDFFHAHCDDAQQSIASRRLTFVYFFHREPSGFDGGELRLYDSKAAEESLWGAGRFQTIIPGQNQIVFFPCSILHEITPVHCPSQAFADSRFTVNGWLHH